MMPLFEELVSGNGLDYGIMAFIGISVIMGIVRGFVREAMSLLTWVTALALGILYCEPVSEHFTRISMTGLRLLLSFILLVLGTLIIGGLLSHLITRVIKFTGFSMTDRLIGTLFGFARGAVLVALGVLLMSATPFSKDKLWVESNLIPRFEPASVWMKERIPEDLLKKFQF